MLTLKDNQKAVLSVAGQDAKGNPATLSTAPTWAVGGANPEIVTIAPSADGLTCEINAVGPLGTAQVTVSDTVGANTLQGVLDITIIAGDATSLAINAGIPSDQ